MVYHSIVIAPTLGLHCAIPQAAQRVSLNETAVSAEADQATLTFCTGPPPTHTHTHTRNYLCIIPRLHTIASVKYLAAQGAVCRVNDRLSSKPYKYVGSLMQVELVADCAGKVLKSMAYRKYCSTRSMFNWYIARGRSPTHSNVNLSP